MTIRSSAQTGPHNPIFTGYYALARKEVMRIFRIWIQTIVPPVISQGLYFLIFGGIIGSQISSIRGISYIEYILPGLIMMSIITNSFMNTASSVIGAKFMKNIEEVIISPVPKWVVLLGYGTGGVVRGLINGFVVLLVAYFFIPFTMYNVFLVLLFSILSAFMFSMAGFFNALFAQSFDQVSIIPTFVLTPLTYLGGVFYSIDQLPPFWAQISRFNPIVYMVDGFRYAFYGIQTVHIGISFAVLMSLSILFFGLNWYLLRKGYGIRS